MNKNANLTKSQLEFADDKSDFLIVSAGPGAGKTQTLVHYLDNIIMENEHKSILVSSFTNNSTNDIKNRFKIFSNSKNKNSIHFKTFDSFLIYKVWKYYFNRIINFAISHFGLKSNGVAKITLEKPIFANEKWSTFKEKLINEDKEPLSKEVLKFISEAKKGILLVNYISEYILFKFIEKDLAIKKYIISRYERIIIDEAQDLNLIRMNILLLLNKSGLKITFVGDDRQSIYSFLGSEPELLNELISKKDFNTTPLKLYDNFRFKDIEAPENKNIKMIFDSKNREELTKAIVAATVGGDIDETTNLGKYVSTININQDSVLIITNTNADVKEISMNLDALNIPNDYREKLSSDLYHNIDDVLFIENLYLYNEIINHRIKRSKIKNNIVQDIANHIWKADPERNNKFLKLFWNHALNYREILIKLSKQLKIENMMSIYDSMVENPHLISQLPISGIKVMTIHGSKGLEADYVFFPRKIMTKFLGGNKFYGFENIYVALSRAKKKIILF